MNMNQQVRVRGGENYQGWQQFKVTLLNCADISLEELYMTSNQSIFAAPD